MSKNEVVLNTQSQLYVNTDLSKIFIWDNRYDTFQYTNGGGDPITLDAGTLMGKISANGKVTPLTSAANDGSQFPIGILARTVTVAAGATVNVPLCVAGDVAQEKVIFQGNDGFATVVSGRQLRDRIGSDTVGIKLVISTELTAYDNS